MKWTRGTLIFGFLLYIFLWILFLNGASTLLPLIAVPPILVVLVGGGNFLDNVLGIRRRPPKFRDRNEKK